MEEKNSQLVHLERLLSDARQDLAAQQSSLSHEERLKMEDEVEALRILTSEQDEVIGEMEAESPKWLKPLRELLMLG